MSQSLRLLPEEMRAVARDIERLSDDVDQLWEALQHSWRRLDHGWHSYARENVDGYYRRAMREVGRAVQMLAQVSGALQTTAHAIVAADQASAAFFGEGQEVPGWVVRAINAVDARVSVGNSAFQGIVGAQGAVLGAMTVNASADLSNPLPGSLELPDFAGLSWAKRFTWFDKIGVEIGKIADMRDHLADVIAEDENAMKALDTRLADLRARLADLQKEADARGNKWRLSEDGLRLGFDDGLFDAPWRTRSDDYEQQMAEIDQQIAELERERQTYVSHHARMTEQYKELQHNLTEMEEARDRLGDQLQTLKRFDGQTPAEEVIKKPWSSVDAPVKNAPGERDARVYDVVIDQFAVGRNKRYDKNQQNKGETYCNIFVWDTTRAMGAEIPHWVNDQGNPVPQGQGRELSANGSIRWLETHGAERGWSVVTAQDAQQMANQGKPVVATYENPGGIGHVAMVRPGEYSLAEGPRIAQAGGRNFNEGSLHDGFRDKPVVYYMHN
jgi:WXG100 family type VII secretion target